MSEPRRRPRSLRSLAGTAIAIAVRGCGALAALLVTLLVARSLGAAESGLFFLCFTVLQVVANVARLGLDSAVLRFGGEAIARDNWAAARQVLSVSSRWTLVASIILVALLFPFAGVLADDVFGKPEVATPLRISLLAVPLLALLPVIGAAMKSAGRAMAGLAVQSILAPAATALLLLPLLLTSFAGSAVAATGALAAGHGVALMLALMFWRQSPRHGDAGAAPSTRMLAASARPMFAVSLMTMAMMWSAQLVAAALLPANELAWLNVAQRIAAVLALPHMAIAATLAARSAGFVERGDHAGLAAAVGQATRLSAAFAVIPAVAMLVAPAFVMSLFGDDFRGGGLLLAVLIIGQVANVMTGPCFLLLNVSGHERDIRNVTLASGILAVLFAVGLTHAFGAIGAALATTLGMAIQNLLLLVAVRRRLGFWTLTGR